MELNDQTKQNIVKMQNYQQQYQNLMLQKDNLVMMLSDIKNASFELKNSNDDVYKIVGPILVKSDNQTLENYLKEKKETLELRIRTLEKQENKFKEKIEEIQQKLKSLLNTANVNA